MRHFWFVLLASAGLLMAQDDYFLGSRVSLIQIQGGWNVPDKSSDIYTFSEENLTFDSDELDGPLFQINYQFQVNNYVAIGGGWSHYSEKVDSEDRFYEFEDGDAIRQETSLETNFVGAMVTITPFGAGTFGTKAWLPRLFVPYIQVAAGFKSWDFYQDGYFVDVDTLEVFRDTFTDDGVSGALRAGIGLRINITKNIDFDLSAQQDFADDELAGDFEGFGDLDLGAKSYLAGITLRF